MAVAHAQDQPPQPDQSVAPESGITDFRSRLWVSGQANFIRQQNPPFDAKYSGPNSFGPAEQHAISRVLTLFTGFRFTDDLEFLFDLESAGGAGLSNALGIAGFTNLDVVRNPTLGSKPYVARIMLHGTIPLSKEMTETTKNPLSLATLVPDRRIELRAGKMSDVDFFDVNAIGSDSHLQFMNWAIDNNGAYDYAADTRGYTYGILAEYYDHFGVFRYGMMLMPTVANGITLDWDIARARGDNFELELHRQFWKNHDTAIRSLAYVNHAAMGNYRDAINQYLTGRVGTPDITLSRKQGRVKYGFGLNIEQRWNAIWRSYGRLGWNDGRNESFAYTEIDRTAQIGTDVFGKPWHRPADKIGVAFVDNGISGDHREYLALGGLGFLLGDGGLRYGQERIVESYYDANLYRGIYFAGDIQHVDNPGYNQDRGPAWVFSLRLHIEDAIPFH